MARHALIYLPVRGRHLQLRLLPGFRDLDLSFVLDLHNYFRRPDGVTPLQNNRGQCMQGEPMEGIHFVTNEKGKKVAVQIDLERYGELWEDIHDQLVAASRAHEKSVPFEAVTRRLERRKRQARG